MIPKLIYIILKFDFLAARDWEVGKLSSLKVEKALRLRGVDCEDTIDGDTIDGTQSTAHNQGPPMRVLSGVEDPIPFRVDFVPSVQNFKTSLFWTTFCMTI